MKDKEIRTILIEYLKIQHPKCRIYQEKSIGGAICDLMLVTDRLTGYEIKSDSDDYSRLTGQVKAYSAFFDENYVVVGQKHVKGVEGKVPPEWGILSICQHGVEVVRQAKANPAVSRMKQLSILWKIELKNILLKNGLPLFAQKEKPFLCMKIASLVDGKRLRRQIAEELMARDYAVFGATDHTIRAEEVPEGSVEAPSSELLPTKEIIDCLSEEDLSQFTLDKWMALYRQAMTLRRQKEEQARTLTEERIRAREAAHKIPYTDIQVTLGAPWISADIIRQFVEEVFKVVRYSYDLVKYESITGHWHVEKCLWMSHKELVSVYGTHRFNAMQILECTLNLRQIRLYDGTKYNEPATLAAIEKQRDIQEAFRKWIWQDADRRFEVEAAYNKLFGDYEVPMFDGQGLALEGMSPAIQLFDYQKRAVEQIVSMPNTLLAFDVGAGKTYIMIAAAMEMRQSGLSRKNLFVVPNNIVGQWERMFLELYPKAKVLTIEPKSFTPEKRNKVLTQMKNQDYDGIIMAYSCFEMIPLSREYLMVDVERSIQQFSEQITALKKKTYFPRIDTIVSNEIHHMKKQLEELLDCMATPASDITFDQLEINTLFVDEAHNFKNIPLRSCMKQVRGVNIRGSKKCLEMLKKVRFVQKSNGGRGVVFATGTPLSNSISDTYAMQCYLQYGELKKKGSDRFDNWVKTFAEIEEVCEIDVDTAGFRMVHRFRRFFNLPELSKMFAQISIFHQVRQEGLPKLLGYTDVAIEKSEALNAYMQALYERTKRIRDGNVDRKKDNMLKVSTDGRKAALSLALVGEEQAYDASSKIWHCVANVMDIYHHYEGCAQLIFCDYSTPKASKFNVYRELKQRLMERGVPPAEIAFVHSCKNEEQKAKLYEAVNEGQVRILIGSTFKLGIGANVQTKLKAIHHLDVPWRPADMVQREGRILRRGNENEEIQIFRYVVKGSFDSYSWQILETKQHFISQFLSGCNTIRSIEDFENDELSYAQVKALALSEPLMKEYAETENQLRRARMILRQEVAERAWAAEEVKKIEQEMAVLSEQLEKTKENATYVASHLSLIRAACKDMAQGLLSGVRLAIGEFSLAVPLVLEGEKLIAILERCGVEYHLELGKTASGNKTRLVNFFERFERQVAIRETRLQELTRRRQDLEQQATYSSSIQETIQQLEAARNALFERISSGQKDKG